MTWEMQARARSWLGWLVLVAGVSMPRGAHAQTGAEIGGGLGYSAPLGEVTDQERTKLNELIAGQGSLLLDLGYRANVHLFAGGYFELGRGWVGDSLAEDCGVRGDDSSPRFETCTVNVVRLGVQVQYRSVANRSVFPWAGLGVGWEIASLTLDGPPFAEVVTLSGIELARVQAGLDFRASRLVRVGPYVGAALGQYFRALTQCDSVGCPEGGRIEDKAFHAWLSIGVRVHVGPF